MDGAAFMREVAARIVKKSPCHYEVARHLTCFDPHRMVSNKGN